MSYILLQGNYFISFTILSESLEDKSFNLNGIHVVNVILEYFYLGLLILCYILALGNRPQGAKWLYTFAFIGFAIITIYMTVWRLSRSEGADPLTSAYPDIQIAAFFLAFKGVENVIKSDGPLSADSLFTNSIFRNIVISLLATLGLYILASLIFVRAVPPVTISAVALTGVPAAVRAVAHDHVVLPVSPHGAFIYQRPERLRCACLLPCSPC